jgi:DNA recombination-dependent growth factor C
MKQITIYTAKATPIIEVSPAALYQPLTQQQDSSIGLVELFEGKTLQEIAVADNSTLALKIKHSVRKEPKQDVIDEEVATRLKGDETEEQVARIEEEVYLQAKRLSGVTNKTYLAFVNFNTNQILIDAPRNVADEGIAFILQNVIGNSSECEFELFKLEAVIMEKLLTQYILKESTVPEPFMLGETTHLGKKSELDKNPAAATVKISKVYASDEEVLAHTKVGKYVKLLELDYDGVMSLQLDNTFFIKGVKYFESLNHKDDPDTADSVNFITEYTDKLAAIYDAVSILKGQSEAVSI